MAALARFLQDIFDTLGLPAWAGTAVVFGAIALSLPWILRNRQTELARKMLRASARLEPRLREEAEQQVLAKVRGHPMGLLVVAEEAHKLGRDGLARRALDELRPTGRYLAEQRALIRELDGPMPATVDEAVLTVRRLREAGMRDVADEKLARYRTRWPDDPELASLYEGSEPSPLA